MEKVESYILIDGAGNTYSGAKDEDVIDMLSNLPPSQPEVIYCKDCARYDGMGHCERDVRDILGYGREWNEDDYCSDGIRREA